MCDTSRKSSSFKKNHAAFPGGIKTDNECLTKYAAINNDLTDSTAFAAKYSKREL